MKKIRRVCTVGGTCVIWLDKAIKASSKMEDGDLLVWDDDAYKDHVALYKLPRSMHKHVLAGGCLGEWDKVKLSKKLDIVKK